MSKSEPQVKTEYFGSSPNFAFDNSAKSSEPESASKADNNDCHASDSSESNFIKFTRFLVYLMICFTSLVVVVLPLSIFLFHNFYLVFIPGTRLMYVPLSFVRNSGLDKLESSVDLVKTHVLELINPGSVYDVTLKFSGYCKNAGASGTLREQYDVSASVQNSTLVQSFILPCYNELPQLVNPYLPPVSKSLLPPVVYKLFASYPSAETISIKILDKVQFDATKLVSDLTLLVTDNILIENNAVLEIALVSSRLVDWIQRHYIFVHAIGSLWVFSWLAVVDLFVVTIVFTMLTGIVTITVSPSKKDGAETGEKDGSEVKEEPKTEEETIKVKEEPKTDEETIRVKEEPGAKK